MSNKHEIEPVFKHNLTEQGEEGNVPKDKNLHQSRMQAIQSSNAHNNQIK